MKMRFLVPLLAAGAVLVGCETTKTVREPTYQEARDNEFIPANQAATKQLLAQLTQSVPAPSTLVIASLANVDALETSSTFGRIVSEQISAEFTKSGYRMREMKLRNSVGITGEGEMLLSREIRELAHSYDAQAVVVGSYATSRDFVYINLKVVHPQSNTVLAVHDYALPMDSNNRRMLRN